MSNIKTTQNENLHFAITTPISVELIHLVRQLYEGRLAKEKLIVLSQRLSFLKSKRP